MTELQIAQERTLRLQDEVINIQNSAWEALLRQETGLAARLGAMADDVNKLVACSRQIERDVINRGQWWRD